LRSIGLLSAQLPGKKYLQRSEGLAEKEIINVTKYEQE